MELAFISPQKFLVKIIALYGLYSEIKLLNPREILGKSKEEYLTSTGTISFFFFKIKSTSAFPKVRQYFNKYKSFWLNLNWEKTTFSTIFFLSNKTPYIVFGT